MKLFKLLCGIVLCVGLCCVIAGGGIFYARRGTAGSEKKIKTQPTYRLSAFTEIENRDTLTLCAARGLSATLPENTLEAVRAAGEAGYRFVLLDVVMTRDKVPVLLSDDTLSRMTAQDHLVRATDFDVLRSCPLDNGAGIDPLSDPVFIPTLAEALDVCKEYAMTPLLTVRTLRGITQLQTVLRSFGHPYLVASSEKNVLDAFRGEACTRLYSTGALSGQTIRYAQKADCGLLFDAAQTRTPSLTDTHGISVWAGTVRSRTQLRALVDSGIRNIVTDCILPLRSNA